MFYSSPWLPDLAHGLADIPQKSSHCYIPPNLKMKNNSGNDKYMKIQPWTVTKCAKVKTLKAELQLAVGTVSMYNSYLHALQYDWLD